MYRAGKVATAIGITPMAFRNWLRTDRHGGGIDLFEQAPDGGWRSFSENDVFVLATAAQLVKFGCPVPRAIQLVRECLGATKFATWEGLPGTIYATIDPDGRWIADPNEAMLGMGFRNRIAETVIHIRPAVLFANVRRRLTATEEEN